MLATDMTASGSPEEKLRWAFKMYDKVERFLDWSNLATLGKMKNFWTIGHEFQDDSGTIEMAELVEIIGTLYEMEVVKLSKLPLFQLKTRYQEPMIYLFFDELVTRESETILLF